MNNIFFCIKKILTFIVKHSKIKSKVGAIMLRIKDIMEKYKVSKPTIYKWIKMGLPKLKVGKITYIEEKELIKFIKGE